MKINLKVFSLPPHISTSWDNVEALHLEQGSLVITLRKGQTITIPHLDALTLEMIFATHAAYLDASRSPKAPEKTTHSIAQGFLPHSQGLDAPAFRIAISSMDELGAVMQHNPAQAGAPDIPHEILEKIATVAKMVAPADMQLMSTPQPNCNCIHCQIARTVTHAVTPVQSTPAGITAEEDITAADLQFQQWQIAQIGDNLYRVTNKLDPQEHYNVYLGEPSIGCTCGKSGCEHIVAVLKH